MYGGDISNKIPLPPSQGLHVQQNCDQRFSFSHFNGYKEERPWESGRVAACLATVSTFHVASHAVVFWEIVLPFSQLTPA